MLDAGPLIALLFQPDAEHRTAVAGFDQLARAGTRVIVPLPIVFEAYKWLLYEAGPSVAQVGLQRMRRGLQIVYPDTDAFADVAAIVATMPRWGGSLEDALVAVMGLQRELPVWTLNFRDLAAFGQLAFWVPANP